MERKSMYEYGAEYAAELREEFGTVLSIAENFQGLPEDFSRWLEDKGYNGDEIAEELDDFRKGYNSEATTVATAEIKEFPNTVHVGDFVIVNEMDRPCTRLVAKVLSVEDFPMITCVYLSANTSVRIYQAHVSTLTNIFDFGCEIAFYKRTYRCREVEASQAKYHHGGIRKWQEEQGDVTQPLAPSCNQKVDG